MADQNARTPQPHAAAPAIPASTNNQVRTTAPVVPRPTAQARKSSASTEPKDGIREIVETIVFVVVLVLLLKSFVAEAFVIPTGSMAQTLYGYQKLVTCPECHHEFPVNCSNEVEPQHGQDPIPVTGCFCPNCRYQIDFAKWGIHPSCNNGDRVLVGKFLYDLKALNMDMPKRQDVVVFKYPKEPVSDYVPMNYIKRLVGLPGETIAIYYGDLYVLDGLKYDHSDVPENDLWKAEYMHINEAVDRFKEFHIIRKGPAQILSMRRIVYDNDHQATDLLRKVPPRWTAEPATGAWQTDSNEEAKRFTSASSATNQTAWLRYRNMIPDLDRENPQVHAQAELISDFMGYNTWQSNRGRRDLPAQNWVGDLILDCDVDVQQPQGALTLELSKGVDRFQARWDLSTGVCTLVRLHDGREETLENRDTNLKKPGTYHLRFANVDERLTVWVDSALPFGDGHVYDPPGQRGPTKNDLQPASIGVQGAGVEVSHLKLWRDTYYTANINSADASGNYDLANPSTWETLRGLPVRTYYVQPHHFLCMGDNSPESSDSRSWGTVPERLLLGRALVIYWPVFGRFGRIE
jgi:signal peptidase I